VAERLQLLVRIAAADDNGYCTCVSCGVTRHYKDSMQGGHFIGRKWTATRLMVENVHPQCAYCNGPLRGNNIPYTLWMEDNYGREFVEELLTLKHQSKKYSRGELDGLMAEFNEQIRFHETRVVG
jgi:hypothetical protein